MKTAVFAISLILAVVSFCHESVAATPEHRFFHDIAFTYKHHPVETHAPVIELKPLTGVIPRSIRSGDPLQMLNPFAPAKYGTAEENTVFDPDVP